MDNTLIIGAGKACRLLLKNSAITKRFPIVGVLDDSHPKGMVLAKRYPILGTLSEIEDIITTHKVKTVVIALPSERGITIRKVLLSLRNHSYIEIYIIPRLPEVIIRNSITLDEIKKIEPIDLIGGRINLANQTSLMEHIRGKTILITGAGGFIGCELSRQISLGKPKKMILIDNSEKNLFYLQYVLSLIRPSNPETKIDYVLGDINNEALMKRIYESSHIHTVFHAAAYKHVPLLEDQIYEAVSNNVHATYTVARLASYHKVKRFILISTDKAVKPDSVMGTTKCIAEHIMHHFDSISTTIFTSVRFGNVFNSSGSVIELFLKQIERDEKLTITNPDMERFFMSVSEAVHLVLNAWKHAQKKTTYMFEMGSSVPIVELANCLLVMHHKQADYPVALIGNRKGEKIHEQLWNPETEIKMHHVYDQVFALQRKGSFDQNYFIRHLNILMKCLDEDHVRNHSPYGTQKLRRMLKKILHV
ncbi:MAG: polysaccharide biosynthesis protein [Microgenomates group bacterium]